MKNSNSIKAQLWLGFYILIWVITGCKTVNNTIVIEGYTMGTTYSLKIVETDSREIDVNDLKVKIDSVLFMINQQMSTYVKDSEISRFNELSGTEWFPISSQFYDVITRAQEISKLTNGAFDFTVGPLVNLWGFGTINNSEEWKPPTSQAIKTTMESIGYDNIIIGKNSIRKKNPECKIDLNAIAKGYGVDIVFELLRGMGINNILVEIGGEVRCFGYNIKGEFWKIGIDKPSFDAIPGAELQTVVNIGNNSLATSGNYRNYHDYDGEIFSHTIDPITGCPTKNRVVSTSVIAPDCKTADALATALMVLGENGIDLINSLKDVETMIIIREKDNTLTVLKSNGWVSD